MEALAIIDLGKESVEVARIEVGQASINFRDVISAHRSRNLMRDGKKPSRSGGN